MSRRIPCCTHGLKAELQEKRAVHQVPLIVCARLYAEDCGWQTKRLDAEGNFVILAV